MTRDHLIGRRALLAGAGALGGVCLLGLEGCDSSTTPTPAPRPPGTPASGAPAVDLTVRWRHLEARVEPSGLWADLLAAWTFDEGSGYAFTDVSGNGHALFVTGSDWNTSESGLLGAIHRQGLRGGAVALTGRRWLAAEPTTALGATGRSLTLTSWVRPDGLPITPAGWLRLGAFLEVGLDTTGMVTLTVSAGDSAGPRVLRAKAPLPIGSWSHVAVRIEPSNGSLTILLDGVVSASGTGPPFTQSADAAVEPTLGTGFVGLLDQTTWHGRALSDAEVGEVRELGLPRTFTQTSESIDADRRVFTRFKGSEPIPHPVEAGTVLLLRLARSFATEQGDQPVRTGPATFVPGPFGCGWLAGGTPTAYASPLTGDSGTFEAWYTAVADPADSSRQRPHLVLEASGATTKARVALSTQAGRWRIDVTSPLGRVTSTTGPTQLFPAGTLAHVAVAWGLQPDGRRGVQLLVDGRPVAFVATELTATTYDGLITLGGSPAMPAGITFHDVRLSSLTLGWGGTCPRGQAMTEAAGLDLRDWFRRPPGLAPLWWRPGAAGPFWRIVRREWQDPTLVGDDPSANLAVDQPNASGVRSLFHPDAFGHASSIEATVSVEALTDGWTGVFVQSQAVALAFSGITLMVNPGRSLLRLARYAVGRVVAAKTLPLDFAFRAQSTYELTLTCAGDSIVRGFVDHSNVISMRTGIGWPTQGFAGLVTDACSAAFSAVHFTALTPAATESRTIHTHVLRYGEGAAVASVELVPFRWHKRRGLLPWQYVSKDPEPAGNIAGAATPEPARPIPSAHWRSEDSANTDLIVVDGTVWLFMRGDPRIDDVPTWGRIGVLHTSVSTFDGLHFVDPSAASEHIVGAQLLTTSQGASPATAQPTQLIDLNAPSTAYVGPHTLLFLGRASPTTHGTGLPGQTVYARFDTSTGRWEQLVTATVAWGAESIDDPGVIHGSPELVSLRHPVTDEYQAVVFEQLHASGDAVMTTAMVDNVAAGVPALLPGMPLHTSLSRANGGSIYGFRVMFDNGIYYLHYNDGPQVPDWPARFVLAATLDPYAGPWVANADTTATTSTYFTRGSEFQPDNGAIWQGTMCKLDGRYYLYYENYHSIGDVNVQYGDYGAVQAGSRVGFATA